MTDPDAIALLEETLDLLNDAPRFSLRRDRQRDSYSHATRIEAFLARRRRRKAAPDAVIAAVRERWRLETGICVADAATIRSDAQGLWVSAWLLVGTPVPPIDMPAYLAALNELSPLAREVFLLHRQDGLDLAGVASRLGLPPAETETIYLTAVADLHRRLFPRP